MIRWSNEPYKVRRSCAFLSATVSDGDVRIALPPFPAEDDPRWGPWRTEYLRCLPGLFRIGLATLPPEAKDAKAPRTAAGRRPDAARLLGRRR